MKLKPWGKSGVQRIYVNDTTASERAALASLPFVTLKGTAVSFPPVPYLAKLLVSKYNADGEAVRSILASNLSSEVIPPSVPWAEQLQDYQKNTVAFGLGRRRFICADDRGLGKTLEALTLCCTVGANTVLIVTPNYLKYNWKREIERWGAPYSVTLAEGTRATREKALQAFSSASGPKALIVNYEMLRLTESKGGYMKQLEANHFETVIFDEAHRLKGRKSQWVKGALEFSKVPYMVMLTGNPIDRNPADIWSLLHILYPQQFTSYWGFVNYFCNVHETLFGREIVGINKEHEPLMADMLKDYIIQHTKQAVAAFLPDKLRRTLYVSMGSKQAKFYSTIEKEMLLEFQDGKTENIETFATKHLRLCQAAACPAAIGGLDESAVDGAIVELCEDLREEQRKLIVVTYFVPHADALEARFTKDGGYSVYRISAKLTPEQRDSVIQAFKTDTGEKPAILIGTIKTMSEGLNIDECDCMIFADKAFTPMPNEQMEDRIHRLTSTRQKMYYTVIARGTVQEDKQSVLEQRAVDRDELWARMETMRLARCRLEGKG